MKLQGKILSIVLSLVLCCAMLPAASAELLPQEDAFDFSLDTVTAYDSFATMMSLRASRRLDSDVTLTITYDTSKATLIAASAGLLYHGEEPTGEDGNIQFSLNSASFDAAAVLAFFQFILPEGATEDVIIHLEAKKADGTTLATKDGLIRPTYTDDSFSLVDNDRIISPPDLGVVVAIQGKMPLSAAKEVLTPADGCTFIAYHADGTTMIDSDMLYTGCIFAAIKGDVVVSQGVYILLGDLDSNGEINASDALLTLQSSVNLITLSEFQWAAADCNADQSVNASDALLMLQYSVGLIPYCIG